MRGVVAALVMLLPVGSSEVPDESLPPTAAEALTKVAELLGSGKTSAALRVSRAAARAFPDDGMSRLQYGILLSITNQYAEARSELERSVALMPESAEAHARLGLLLDNRGEPELAERALERALAIQPDHPLARTLLDAIHTKRRIRSGTRPKPAADSAAATVVAFAELVERGQMLAAVEHYVDPEVLGTLMRQLGAHDDKLFLAGMVMGIKEGFGVGSVVGWEVAGEGPGDDSDSATVTLNLLNEVTFDRRMAEQTKRMYTRPQAETVAPELVALYSGLEPGDLDATFERAIGTRGTTILPVVFELARDSSGRWIIRDLVVGPIRLSTYPDQISTLSEITGIPPPKRDPEKSDAFSAGERFGRRWGTLFAAIAAAAVALVFGVRWLVRRS